MTRPKFSDLALLEELQDAIRSQGYEQPTPIQSEAIPHLLKQRDLLGIAQTGTGKTAAFALPILDRLGRDPVELESKSTRVLVLTPTRELAAQIEKSFAVYGGNLDIYQALIFGGVGQAPQVRTLKKGVDVLVATPGRLLDLMNQGHVDLSWVEVFVLDEADRMLDMGFIHDVKRVISCLPEKRHTLLFSATMPSDIVKLAKTILINPVRVEVTPPSTTAERVQQRVYLVEKRDKRKLLGDILEDESIERTLVFTRTKHGANRVAQHLRKLGEEAQAIHGDKSQGARERALEGFRNGKVRVLVATDIAARGIDVPGISHVINFDLPNVPETYVHRIGRTARAGKDGIALSFCDIDERVYLGDIEKEVRQALDVVEEHPFKSTEVFDPVTAKARAKAKAQAKAQAQSARRPNPNRGSRGGRRRGGNSRSTQTS